MTSTVKLFCALLISFLFSTQKGNAQQIIIYVHNASAMALRGTNIPGQVTSTGMRKFTAANSTIPRLIREHRARISIYRTTIFGNLSQLSAMQVQCTALLGMAEELVPIVSVARYIPGFRDTNTRLIRARIRFFDLNQKLSALAGFSAFLIDGTGYINVSHQTLANDYIFIFKEFRDIVFKLRVLESFIGVIQTINH